MSEQGYVEGGNKKIALLVAILAALLAVSETAGKSAQTHALSDQITASNLWSFFQAKTIRQTTMRTAAEAIEAQYGGAPQPMPAGVKNQLDTWRKTAARYESEPETNEGRKELLAQATAKEADRDKALSAYHMFEYGSAALQLAIVLAGASALTTVVWLMFTSIGLGMIGVAFAALGFLAPTLIHL
jgi:hypothetical protein